MMTTSLSPTRPLLAANVRMNRCPTCGHGTIRTPDTEPIEVRALRAIAADLEGCSAGLWRFFEVVFGTKADRCAKSTTTHLGVNWSTLNSRFHRAGVPSPKRYTLFVAFMRTAALYEQPGAKALDVAVAVGYGSAQSLHRALRVAGFGAIGRLRREHTGETMLVRLRETLILPHRERLLAFDPLNQLGQQK